MENRQRQARGGSRLLPQGIAEEGVYRALNGVCPRLIFFPHPLNADLLKDRIAGPYAHHGGLLVGSDLGVKPEMLLALPEYKSYIEKYGFAGYYHLLDVLQQKLLNAIAEMLEGKELDAATLKASVEIMSSVRELTMQQEIPDDLRGPEIPRPA